MTVVVGKALVSARSVVSVKLYVVDSSLVVKSSEQG
jgi:hypothetical protein